MGEELLMLMCYLEIFVNAFIKLEIQYRADKSQPHHRPTESLSHKNSF